MSLGKFLLTPENLDFVKKNSWKFGREAIIDQGMKWYEENPEEVQQIADNLAYMGLPHDGKELDTVLREIVIHYYEKLFVLVKSYEAYWIVKNRVEIGNSLEPYLEAKRSGKGVFIGQSHFGVTYLMASVLMVHGFDVNTVGKFPEPVGSMLQGNINSMSEKYQTGQARLINIANPDVNIPFEMRSLLKAGKFISNVFDENNSLCIPVTLLGKEIMGGTGMDRILQGFTDDEIVIVTPFLIRTGEDSFRYEVDRHYLKDGNIIHSFYRSLEKRVREYYPQWYFIHELHESMEVIRAEVPERVRLALEKAGKKVG